MKKSLSLLLTFALVFGLFANMASAAETPASAGKYLFDNKIIQGNGTDLLVNDTWKRQDLAVLLSRLLGVEAEAKATAKSHTYKDVRGTFYDGYLSWAREKGYLEGASATSFGFDQLLNNQSFAAVVLRALGVDTTGDKYKDVPELAVEAGIVPEGTDWSAPAKRGETYVAIYTALGTVVGDTGRTLGDILGLPGFEVKELGLGKVEQTGAKKITANFNRALKAEEETALKAEVKNNVVNYPVTITVAEDKKSAVLEAAFLPAGEYDVKVNEFDAVKVTVVAGVVTKVDIGASALQATYKQDLQVKALNQFNEEVKNETVNVTAFSSQTGDLSGKFSAGKLDLSDEKIDNTVVVTASHPTTGKTATKTFKLVAGSSVTNIQFGQVAPLKDKDRISVNEKDLVLPVTLADQYGTTIKLSEKSSKGITGSTSVTLDGIQFVSSDADIIDLATVLVNDKGVVTFETGAKSGTVVITALNPATGANASTTVKVEAAATLKTFQLSNASSVVVKDEWVTFPYVAADTFGAPIAAKDVPAKVTTLNADPANKKFVVNGAEYKFKANGDFQLKFANKGNNPIFIIVNGIVASQLNVNVEETAYPVNITGVKDIKTTAQVGVSQDFATGNLVVVDNYGRTMDSKDFTATFQDGDNPVQAGTIAVSRADAGSKTIKVVVTGNGKTVNRDFTFTMIKQDDVKTVEISAAGTVYAADSHKVTLKLTGKTASGTEVAINTANGVFYDFVTSSDNSVASAAGLVIEGHKKGEATITVWKNGTEVNKQVVTVSDVTPVVTSVKFTATEGSATLGTATVPAVNFDAAAKLEIKDQYGKEVTPKAGKWYTSDDKVATVDVNGEVKAVKLGTVTITFVSNSGLSATISVASEE